MRYSAAVLMPAVLALALVGCEPEVTGPEATYGTPSLAATATTDNLVIQFAQITFVPCAAGGAGESVLFSGDLHILNHITIDDNGGFHATIHFQPMGASGVGLSTGDTYHGTGETRETFNVAGSGLPITDTFVNNFKIIGEGPDNNLLIHETIHITINANGELTAEVGNFSTECR